MPPRRTRQTAKLDNAEGDNPVDEGEERKRKRKRVKASETSKKAKGDLRNLPSMPLDILCEIFSVVHPRDLLALARTTKALRGVLLRRATGRGIWRASLAEMSGPEMPKLPESMCEPQWASLVFDDCQFCTDPKTLTELHWKLGMRACTKCFSKRIVGLEEDICALAVGCPWANLLAVDEDDYSCISEELNHVQACLISLQGDEEALGKYIFQRMKVMWQWKAFVREGKPWYLRMQEWEKKSRSAAKASIREERCNAIRARLEALGWGPELEKLWEWDTLRLQFCEHKLVKQKKPLTDRMWKNMESAVVELLQTLNTERLERARVLRPSLSRSIMRRLYEDFRKSSTVEGQMPKLEVVLKFAPFRAVVEDTESEEEVCKADFADAMEKLPALVEEWQRAMPQ